MSIVERAMHKLQSMPPARASEIGAPETEASANPKSRVVLAPPAVSITIDRARLARNNLALENADWRTTDEIRRLKWPLLDLALGRDGQPGCGPLLLVTSSVPGEGKTFVAINIAFSFATDLEGGVLLVDGDLAKPHLSDIFGLADRPGLTELLANPRMHPSEVIVGTDIPRLRLLPAGGFHAHAPELLASKRMAEITAWLTETYADSMVVIDSSPLLATNEAQLLARHASQVLLVVRADDTLIPMVESALALIDEGKQVSAALNQTTVSRLSQYYGAYYGKYYGRTNEKNEHSERKDTPA